jgi:hypothetical protein
MKLMEVIEEQLLQNLKNKVQTAAQNVGNKVNSLINKNQEQRTLTSKTPLGKSPSVAYKEFVDKWKPINKDNSKLFGFAEFSGVSSHLASTQAHMNASLVLCCKLSGGNGDCSMENNIRTMKLNCNGEWPVYDESSYMVSQENGNDMYYYAIVVSRENHS